MPEFKEIYTCYWCRWRNVYRYKYRLNKWVEIGYTYIDLNSNAEVSIRYSKN